MAIYDHKYGDLPYFRVYRSWGGKEYQEYVRIRKSRKAAYDKAKEIDERLAAQQREYTIERSAMPEYHIRKDGTIRGLRRILVSRQGRTPVEVYELRINVPWEERVRRTTISIAVHGEEKGFRQAIDKICEWYGLPLESEIHLALLGQADKYSGNSRAQSVADTAIRKAKDEIANLTGGLVKSFKRLTA